MMMRRCRIVREGGGDQEGVALILALLFIVLLSVLVVEFSYEMQVEAMFAMNQGSDFEAYLAAKSAVANGMALLAEDALETMESGEPSYDSEMDPVPWFEGAPFEPLNEATMRASIADEYGKINLNALLDTSVNPPEVRESLAQALREFFMLRLESTTGEDSADVIVDSILDWLDYDDDDEVRDEGAENDYYMGLENPYPCKNGPLDSLEELLLIKGISLEVFYGTQTVSEQEEREGELGSSSTEEETDPAQLPLSEYLTVHGEWRGRVNVNTAREEVIAAIRAGYMGDGLDLMEGQRVYDMVREQPCMTEEDLSSRLGMTRKTQTTTSQTATGTARDRTQTKVTEEDLAGDAFTWYSNVFRIYGDGMLEDVLVRVEAYVWRMPVDMALYERSLPEAAEPVEPVEPFRILSWREIR